MSYPDVIACIEHKCVSGSIQSNWGSVGKHDNNMKDYSGGWLITITVNHSNLVCDRANTVCHCQESVEIRNSITAMPS